MRTNRRALRTGKHPELATKYQDFVVNVVVFADVAGQPQTEPNQQATSSSDTQAQPGLVYDSESLESEDGNLFDDSGDEKEPVDKAEDDVGDKTEKTDGNEADYETTESVVNIEAAVDLGWVE